MSKTTPSFAQIAGIYNSPLRKSPHPMELLLRKSKPLSHRRQQTKSPFVSELYDWPTCRRPPTSLPPIARKKPQVTFSIPLRQFLFVSFIISYDKTPRVGSLRPKIPFVDLVDLDRSRSGARLQDIKFLKQARLK